MVVKSFSGRTVAEALSKVRAHLGDGALIIETRPLKEPGLFGRAVGYEVVAGVDEREVEDSVPLMTASGAMFTAAHAPAPAPVRLRPAVRRSISRRGHGTLRGARPAA